MLSLSSHVLDTTTGKPAAQMALTLTCPNGDVARAETDSDGRCKQWGDISLTPGIYQLRFDTGAYLTQHHGKGLYPFVDIHFEMEASGGHYHIPLLISPYGFSSYRGS